MKQTKWQRLATIGLCSSLVINAFSGVTAVAETITIESSPTVASSAKEATSASSATPASTESSQETTETSREEGTQETEKQEVVKEEHKEETEAKKQEEETVTSEVVQPNPVLAPTPVSGIGVRAGNLDSVIPILNSLIIGNKQYYASSTPITFPSTTIGMTLKPMNGESINVADFGLTADATTIIASKTIDTYVNNAVTQQTSTGFDVTLPAIKINFFNKSTRHSLDNIILKVPKYIDNISSSGNGLIMLDYKYEANV